MLHNKLLSIFQNKFIRCAIRFAADLAVLLLLLYVALISSGQEISFVYANF